MADHHDIYFYVPLAYILYLLDSNRFPKRDCFPGDLEFSGIVCSQLSLGIVNCTYRSFLYSTV